MNKTYKVVFNKARGALMAANEITSSVQKKGTKTVIVTAVVSALAMISAGANADNLTRLDNPGSSLSNRRFPKCCTNPPCGGGPAGAWARRTPAECEGARSCGE